MNARIIWHGAPCPEEDLEKVEAELEKLLDGPLESPQQLISHRILLDDGSAVTAWGETGLDAFHAEFHPVPTRERADKALFDRIRQLYQP